MRIERRLACERGHSYDGAREGYFNLLQPQDRRSRAPGDSRDSVHARHRWLEQGHAEPLARAIEELIDGDAAGAMQVLDIGCGDGWFLQRLARGRAWDTCGVELSSDAIRMASRRMIGTGGALWIVANADRGLPFAGRSFDLVLSLFGRRPSGEIRRVLRDEGRLIVAVPGEDDLAELREAVLGRADPLPGGRRLEEELGAEFTCVGARTQRWRATLDDASARDALAMTYRGRRRSEQERGAAGVMPREVTLSADIRVFMKRLISS